MKLELIGKEIKENNQERNKTKNNNEEASYILSSYTNHRNSFMIHVTRIAQLHT
jgi:hypothetical protein